MTKKNVDIEETLHLLILNAIDFLTTSIRELDTSPKYSLINFVTAVELILKAPLLKEHWTLIVEKIDSDKDKVNIDNFIQGRLLTIGFERTIERLDKVLNCKLNNKERICFKNLKDHRNKLIHFYNIDYLGKSEELISQVLIEQCEAWNYLHELLLGKWNDIFSIYRPQIVSLHSEIKGKKKFFSGKYNALKEKLKLIEDGGGRLLDCKICECKSMLLSEYSGMWYIGECLVCDHRQNFLSIKCPNKRCEHSIILDEGYSKCDCCDTAINPEVLMSVFKESSEDIYCTECFKPSVISIEGEYLCLSCFESFDEISECEWCLTKYAGDIGKDTNFKGCEHCDGWTGSKMSKD